MTSAARKLTAILAADVAGYSRLMGADEEGRSSAAPPGGRSRFIARKFIDFLMVEHRNHGGAANGTKARSMKERVARRTPPLPTNRLRVSDRASDLSPLCRRVRTSLCPSIFAAK